MEFMEYYHPEYVIILGGDHIYKMDYELMLEFHKKNDAKITLATYEVPWEDASRFGLVITDENNQVVEFEESWWSQEVIRLPWGFIFSTGTCSKSLWKY